MNGIIDFIVWAPPSCEKREPSEKFKMKIITTLAVVKTLTVLWLGLVRLLFYAVSATMAI